jgi:hypothetical protein
MPQIIPLELMPQRSSHANVTCTYGVLVEYGYINLARAVRQRAVPAGGSTELNWSPPRCGSCRPESPAYHHGGAAVTAEYSSP